MGSTGILGTPGYIFGKQIRAVEWDVAASPGSPNGRVVSFKLRAFTADGIRKAIASRMRLERTDEVRSRIPKASCHLARVMVRLDGLNFRHGLGWFGWQ